MDRRDFLKLVGLATGTSVVAGCDLERTSEKLIPYLVPPEDGLIPGEASFSTSTCTECPAACGVSVRIREKRPVKLEGIGGHPVNDGGLCMRGQASLNRLYHTERVRSPMVADGNGNLVPATWNQALERVVTALEQANGEKLFLAGHTTGSISEMIDEFCSRMGLRRLPEFEMYSGAAVRAANEDLFGLPTVPAYRFDKSDFLLTVGADILDTFGNPVAATSQIARQRAEGRGFTWYHAEAHASLTGFQSGHRLSVRPGSEVYLLACLLHEMRSRRVFTDRRLERHVDAVPSISIDKAASVTGLDRAEIENLVDDFMKARAPLVLAGGVSTSHEYGLDLARVAALIQVGAGMMGSTVDFTTAKDQSHLGTMADVNTLSEVLSAGDVGALIVFRTDPAGRITDGGEFAASLDEAGFLVGVGDVLDETMRRCDVVLPHSHTLESWGDAEPRRGVVNVIQPAFEPLFDTRTDGDILMDLLSAAGHDTSAESYQAYVLDRWRKLYGAAQLRRLVDRGYIEMRVPAVTASLRTDSARYRFTDGVTSGPVVVVSPSVRFFDGRSADLPLLNEIPEPLTSVTWDHCVSASPKTAKSHGVRERDQLQLSGNGWSATLPLRLQPGLPEDVFLVYAGTSPVAPGWSRSSGEALAWADGVSVRRSGGRQSVAIMSGSLYEEGRGAVPGSPPAHFGNGHGVHHGDKRDLSFNPTPDYPEYRWAMAIDMDLCTGCGACAAACYVENNVPLTGRDEHLKGREMSWLRVEPYYDDHGGADFVPAMCQQCDHAPCEAVCPVFATYHTTEGLNAQVYNRCVGTRYCANNCPYKQRRFNWFAWDKRPEPLNLMTNPDVSLRGKGIMEKCTFCIQRIRKARDVASDEDRNILDGDLTTACAQSCPGHAIVFGNLLDENSMVSQWAKSERATHLFEELGTGPAVVYLTSKGQDHGA